MHLEACMRAVLLGQAHSTRIGACVSAIPLSRAFSRRLEVWLNERCQHTEPGSTQSSSVLKAYPIERDEKPQQMSWNCGDRP
jgi:hypothetical protein